MLKVKNILISQPVPSDPNSPFFDIEKKYGVKIDFNQLIRIDPLTVPEFRAQRVDIPSHTAIVFNSRHGINHFFNLCKGMRLEVSSDMKYFCTTEKIAYYLQKYITFRKRKVFFAPDGSFDTLVSLMKKKEEEKFMMVTSDINAEKYWKVFDKYEVHVDRAVMYRTVKNLTPEEPITHDMIVLYTPSGVHAIKDTFPDFEQGERILATLGESTAKTAEELGFRVDIPVPSPQYTSISAAMDDFLHENHKRIRH